jgi:hypothetical protein
MKIQDGHKLVPVEPVAWQYRTKMGEWDVVDKRQVDWHVSRGFEIRPLYAAQTAQSGEAEFHEAVVKLVCDMLNAWMQGISYIEVPSGLQCRVEALLTSPKPAQTRRELADETLGRQFRDYFGHITPEEACRTINELQAKLTAAQSASGACE